MRMMIVFGIALLVLVAACAREGPPTGQWDERTVCASAEDCTPCGDTCISLEYAAAASCPVAGIEECACADRVCVPA